MQGRMNISWLNLCAKRVQCSNRNTQATSLRSETAPMFRLEHWRYLSWREGSTRFRIQVAECSDWNTRPLLRKKLRSVPAGTFVRVFRWEHIVVMFQSEHTVIMFRLEHCAECSGWNISGLDGAILALVYHFTASRRGCLMVPGVLRPLNWPDLFHLFMFLVPGDRLVVSGIGTGGWGFRGPRLGWGAWNGRIPVGGRRSVGLDVRMGLGGWRLPGGLRAGALRRGGLRPRRCVEGGFGRGCFVY